MSLPTNWEGLCRGGFAEGKAARAPRGSELTNSNARRHCSCFESTWVSIAIGIRNLFRVLFFGALIGFIVFAIYVHFFLKGPFCSLPVSTASSQNGTSKRPQLSDPVPVGSTTSEPPQISPKTNYSSARFPSPTNAIAVNDYSSILMAIWRSSDSTPQERANALMKWLPKDTSIAKVEALLGKGGHLSHYFGILFTSVQNTNALTFQDRGLDELVLEYKTLHGPVSLVFSKKPGSSNEVWFDRAFPGSY